MPGMPMSSSTTSGMELVELRQCARRRRRRRGTSWPSSSSSIAEAVGGVAVVVDDQHAQPRAERRCAACTARRRWADVLGRRSAGRRTTNSLPCPGPSLCASTRAAVQLDQPLDQRQADAEPAVLRRRASVRPARTSRRSAADARRAMPMPVSRDRDDGGVARRGRDVDRDRAAGGRRVLGGVVEQVAERPASGASRRRRASDGVRRARPRSSCFAPRRSAAARARSRHRTTESQVDAARGAARSCRG